MVRVCSGFGRKQFENIYKEVKMKSSTKLFRLYVLMKINGKIIHLCFEEFAEFAELAFLTLKIETDHS